MKFKRMRFFIIFCIGVFGLQLINLDDLNEVYALQDRILANTSVWYTQPFEIKGCIPGNIQEKDITWELRGVNDGFYATLTPGDYLARPGRNPNWVGNVSDRQSPFRYKTVYSGVKDNKTYVSLQGVQAPWKYSNVQFRLKWLENGQVHYSTDYESESLFTVHTPETKIKMTTSEQTVYVLPKGRNNMDMSWAVPKSLWNSHYSTPFSPEYSKGNDGNNIAKFTAEYEYRPYLESPNRVDNPVFIWFAKSSITGEPVQIAEVTFVNNKPQTQILPGLDRIKREFKAPNLKIRVETTQPRLTSGSFSQNKIETWRSITTTLYLEGASTSMDVNNTHFYFGVTADQVFSNDGIEDSLHQTSTFGELYVKYPIDIDIGSPVLSNGVYTFPNIKISAPNGLRTVIVGSSTTGGKISVKRNVFQDYNIYVSEASDNPDLWEFRSNTGQPINSVAWTRALTKGISFKGGVFPGSQRNNFSIYISEVSEYAMRSVNLFAGCDWKNEERTHVDAGGGNSAYITALFDATPYEYIDVAGTIGTYDWVEGMTLQPHNHHNDSGDALDISRRRKLGNTLYRFDTKDLPATTLPGSNWMNSAIRLKCGESNGNSTSRVRGITGYSRRSLERANNTGIDFCTIIDPSYDMQPPTVEVWWDKNLHGRTATLELRATDNMGKIVGYIIEDSPNNRPTPSSTWQKSPIFKDRATENKKYYCYAIDPAGNIGSCIADVRNLDLYKPEITSIIVKNAG